jgi:hypothetical protein
MWPDGSMAMVSDVRLSSEGLALASPVGAWLTHTTHTHVQTKESAHSKNAGNYVLDHNERKCTFHALINETKDVAWYTWYRYALRFLVSWSIPGRACLCERKIQFASLEQDYNSRAVRNASKAQIFKGFIKAFSNFE